MKTPITILTFVLFTLVVGITGYSDNHSDKMHNQNAQSMESCPMMGDKCPLMQGQQMGMMHSIMHNDKVELDTENTENGVIYRWTSSDKDAVKQLHEMAARMKKTHPMMKMKMGKGMHEEMMGNRMGMMKKNGDQ